MPTGPILVVDDDPDICQLLALTLELEGYTVRTAVGGQAIPAALALHPALMLVDIAMPGMDGVEVCRRIRADARTRAIPLVLMSAGHRLRERATECEVEALMAKPFDLADVLATVASLAGSR